MEEIHGPQDAPSFWTSEEVKDLQDANPDTKGLPPGKAKALFDRERANQEMALGRDVTED